MLGGRNNQNQRGRATEVYSRTTHHLRRCNLRFNFGRSNTLVGKLNVGVPPTGLGPASDAVDPLGAAGVVASQTMIWHSLATIRDAIRRRRMLR
jgi:hypothetical protein